MMREPAWEAKVAWVTAHASTAPVYSSFAFGEVTDAVARQARRGEMSIDEARALLQRFRAYLVVWQKCETIDEDIGAATEFIVSDFRRSLKLADAILLATARRIDATMLTADRRQAAAATALDISCHFFPPQSEP
jgi:predicted nucleic acid-binding protein